ncbi:helix-turn-helix transcriptional regulator [Streptomyces sp. ICBB 8177]|uniref:helix-turn-helix domain-containing protein n=1 Tax=Streptomyces sp. ICBB 8177 TaxID=563922 RepID=UPI000D67B7BB|nr:helix-turn-helix transcriptional regulator [Streptomyces sp. ICBB 8177]PWI45957.1 transcriptional regulator [Streptomyces sp. ICBB 8177]
MPAAPPPDDLVLRQRQAVGDRIRLLRRERGLTQEQLAERSGLDRKTVSRAENGRYSMPLDHLVMMARALGVHLADLAG